jgi:hypothetical protein
MNIATRMPSAGAGKLAKSLPGLRFGHGCSTSAALADDGRVPGRVPVNARAAAPNAPAAASRVAGANHPAV